MGLYYDDVDVDNAIMEESERREDMRLKIDLEKLRRDRVIRLMESMYGYLRSLSKKENMPKDISTEINSAASLIKEKHTLLSLKYMDVDVDFCCDEVDKILAGNNENVD